MAYGYQHVGRRLLWQVLEGSLAPSGASAWPLLAPRASGLLEQGHCLATRCRRSGEQIHGRTVPPLAASRLIRAVFSSVGADAFELPDGAPAGPEHDCGCLTLYVASERASRLPLLHGRPRCQHLWVAA
jgi:hypothetical protein